MDKNAIELLFDILAELKKLNTAIGSININTKEKCGHCNGRGYINTNTGTGRISCGWCNGRGEVFREGANG